MKLRYYIFVRDIATLNDKDHYKVNINNMFVRHLNLTVNKIMI